jgi:hypothetical protein
MTTLNSEKLASLAKDFAKDYPRSPRDLLAGYIIGMRTLDKCRAALNNTLGEYHFDCPVDNRRNRRERRGGYSMGSGTRQTERENRSH